MMTTTMTSEEIKQLARKSGFTTFDLSEPENYERFAALVAETTLEKAAQVCESKVNIAEDWDSSYWDAACDTCAAAIRSMK